MGRQGAVVAAAASAAAGAAGFLLGRRAADAPLRRLVGANYRWMSREVSMRRGGGEGVGS